MCSSDLGQFQKLPRPILLLPAVIGFGRGDHNHHLSPGRAVTAVGVSQFRQGGAPHLLVELGKFAGDGGLLELGGVEYGSVSEVPSSGYVGSPQLGDTTNAAIERWYNYNWTSHILEPRPTVWAVRTADGRYAKLRILGYYCPGPLAGCLTFEFVYQGGGGTDVR